MPTDLCHSSRNYVDEQSMDEHVFIMNISSHEFLNMGLN